MKSNYKNKEMYCVEKISVLVDWRGKNYSGYITDERINALGIVVAAKTMEELEVKLRDAVQFHVEGCVEDGDELPAWAVQGDYELIINGIVVI